MLGLVSGAVAGLVAVTPASGFAGPMGSIVLGVVAGAGLLLLLLDGQERVRLRRHPRRVRHPLRRRHRRRAGHRHPGQPRPRRRRHPRLHRQARRARCWPTTSSAPPSWRRSRRVLFTLLWSGIGSRDPLQDRRHDRRPARHAPSRSAKVSTSPSMASAPTTTDRSAQARRCARARASRRFPP